MYLPLDREFSLKFGCMRVRVIIGPLSLHRLDRSYRLHVIIILYLTLAVTSFPLVPTHYFTFSEAHYDSLGSRRNIMSPR